MSWPDFIPEGEVCDKLVKSMDILLTICELTGAKQPVEKIDGKSILPVLKSEEMPELDERYFYYYSNKEIKAIRKGVWKYMLPLKYGIVTKPGEDEENGKTEIFKQPVALYNLATDISESNNVIEDFPEIAEELKNELLRFGNTLKSEVRPVGKISDHTNGK